MDSLNRISTKTGDDGTTSLFGKGRVKKNSDTIECVGTIDELVSWIGLIKSQLESSRTITFLEDIQKSLFKISSMIVSSDEKNHDQIINVKEIEDRMKSMIEKTDMPGDFILPGKNILSSQTDLARTVCRRAERRLYSLIDKQGKKYLAESLRYLNRLSDYLFILARTFEAE
ncbi:MAG: cob(I)yrinic acid a,c-diamide adenosyltransferase [Spirochaetes bacterium]|nr:cob(I)yrinic acid a,c-diamide adenosyltransferase [Spirochaetota bacterium]